MFRLSLRIIVVDNIDPWYYVDNKMNLIKYEMKEYSYFRLFLCSYKCNTEEKSLNFINISELKEKNKNSKQSHFDLHCKLYETFYHVS